MEFNLVNLKLTVRTTDPARLALCLAGSGAEFSAACKRLVCDCRSTVCDACSACGACPWQIVFAQKITDDPAALKRHQKPPLPFVFSFPFPGGTSDTSDIMECGLVVVGRAIPHLEMLLGGFRELLARITFQHECGIIQVSSSDYGGNYLPLGGRADLSQADSLAVLSAGGLLEHCPWDCSSICIRLLYPLKIMSDGRLCNRFDFSQFARSLMRRISSMAYYYAEYEFDSDFKLLARKADAVDCIGNSFVFSSGSGGNRMFSGISGHGRFRGEFSGLLPFLMLGSYMHVGKGATFGMGRYNIILEGS